MAKSIGRYEIREELGRGGMAVVYRALDTRLDRDVALKLLDQKLTSDAAFAARFEREAKTVAALEHSAIVSLYDFGEADGWLYLVMRYMPGGTLKQKIGRGPLTTQEAYNVVRRIGGALDKAHNKGIVHRDLKPANVLLDDEQEPYLSDFGIVKLATGGEEEFLTQTGQTLGTFAYMSPEQLLGQDLDGRSDIYALGIVLYEMLTGKHPFSEAATSAAMVIAHTQQPAPDITTDNPDLSPAFAAVIEKALAKEPVDRYATGAEMATAINEAMTGTSAAAPALAVAAATAATAGTPPKIPPDPQPATGDIGAAPPWALIAIGLAVVAILIVVGLFAAGVFGSSEPEDTAVIPPTVTIVTPTPDIGATQTATRAIWLKQDDDGDGLLNAEELDLGTLLDARDTDGDGLLDFDEVMFFSTDPTNQDTDGDTIPDGHEVSDDCLSPITPDTDLDGLQDDIDPESCAAIIPTPSPTDVPSTETPTPTNTPSPVTISFQRSAFPDVTYKGVADATISQWSPNVNDGAAINCRVDGDDPPSTGNDLTTLVSWDVSLVPAGSHVTEATITLNVFNRSLLTYEFYEVRRPWLEDEVTWNSASSGDLWQVPGVQGAEDRDATSLGTLAPDQFGPYEVDMNADALAVIQEWVDDPDSNHGFIITGRTSNDGVDFLCSEVEEATERPLLTITYVESGQ